jgi:hypothetical protein
MVLCEEYGISSIFFSALLEGKQAVTICKLEDDVPSLISCFAILMANVPEIYTMWSQIAFSTYLEQYQKIQEEASKGAGDLLSEFKIEGKFKN